MVPLRRNTAILAGTVAVGALIGLRAHAADLPAKAPIVKAAPEISSWVFEFGSRYWFSSGKSKTDLFAPGGAPQDSRLTYDNLTAHAAEAFWRVDHISGLFLKGFAGGGSINGGHLNDEDFPPAIKLYSNALSDQQHGSLGYATVDLGYNFWTSRTWRLGGFVGYNYWNERLNTFGCTQIAGNAGVCGNVPPVLAPVPASTNVLDNDATWNSLRVGLNGEFVLAPGWKVTADAAYIHGWLDSTDLHNLRPDIRGLPEDATGDGAQIDAILSYQVTDAFSVGVGGRWWHIQGDGTSHFEQTAGGGLPAPIKIEQDRFGLLAQASYKFGESAPAGDFYKAPAAAAPAFHWAGLYAGVNTGYGINSDDTSISPESGNATIAIRNGDSPTAEHIQSAGFLAGGQIGYNWQTGGIVWGVESDLDWARIGGSTATTSTFDFFTTTVDKNLSWLGTTRARVGTLPADNLLLYVTGGVAYGGTELAFDQRQAGLTCTFSIVCSTGSASKTNVGWTVGAGAEYAAMNRLTFKAEYLFADLGNTSLTATGTTGAFAPFTYGVSSKFADNIIRLGLNYKVY